ncbi:hypothetical protein PLESTB_001402000 [Pleodorina starrii]|uniref:Uncharacterized protein n=1 Tax=Pleodorina starrii TaxID=330485 RepID=A0A9W6BUN2_9CHLO|nr:hypothetical protein PLESTM_000530800 [Pleodorina starrii]GLC58796.1 hypothetical protein PLESTB_001402000 [Pleodorina starrii]GLC68729.1 hypothetical protein PLESTF_000728900 [Pleodorina starrii]
MSFLGPNDRRPEVLLKGSTVSHLRTWGTEYVDEYSAPKLAAGVPAVRAEMESISAHVSTLAAVHSQVHNATERLPKGHPPASTFRNPGDPPIGTMTRGSGAVTSIKDSVLYGQEQTWAHWRVAVDGKPQDTRRKYRGVG